MCPEKQAGAVWPEGGAEGREGTGRSSRALGARGRTGDFISGARRSPGRVLRGEGAHGTRNKRPLLRADSGRSQQASIGHGSPGCSPGMSRSILPLGLCTGCACCLDCPPPRYSHGPSLSPSRHLFRGCLPVWPCLLKIFSLLHHRCPVPPPWLPFPIAFIAHVPHNGHSVCRSPPVLPTGGEPKGAEPGSVSVTACPRPPALGPARRGAPTNTRVTRGDLMFHLGVSVSTSVEWGHDPSILGVTESLEPPPQICRRYGRPRGCCFQQAPDSRLLHPSLGPGVGGDSHWLRLYRQGQDTVTFGKLQAGGSHSCRAEDRRGRDWEYLRSLSRLRAGLGGGAQEPSLPPSGP